MLGLNVTRKLLLAMHETVPILRALPGLNTGEPRAALAQRAPGVRPWSLHDGEVVPHALVASGHRPGPGRRRVRGRHLRLPRRARQPEPWLANALADTFLASVREEARLLASAGFDVSRRPVVLLDLPALFQEADADANFSLLSRGMSRRDASGFLRTNDHAAPPGGPCHPRVRRHQTQPARRRLACSQDRRRVVRVHRLRHFGNRRRTARCRRPS